jgi:hypothetical protein
MQGESAAFCLNLYTRPIKILENLSRDRRRCCSLKTACNLMIMHFLLSKQLWSQSRVEFIIL